MRLNRLIAAIALSVSLLGAQQSNSSNGSMTIDGNDGPTYPMNINCRTSLPALFHMGGGTNVPFVIVGSASGNLQAGSATYWGDHYDLPLVPAYVVCLDGLANGTFKTDFTGNYSFQVTCPPVGTPPTGVPLNFHAAYQAGMVDYFSPFGWSLTAATRITVTQGPIVTLYSLGDESSTAISMTSLPIPFYGSNQTQLHLCSNGYVTFGTANVDFTPTDAEMNSGPPRIAPFWTDLDCLSNGVKTTLDTNPGHGSPRVHEDRVHERHQRLRSDGHPHVLDAHEGRRKRRDHVRVHEQSERLRLDHRNRAGQQPRASPDAEELRRCTAAGQQRRTRHPDDASVRPERHREHVVLRVVRDHRAERRTT